ncbi:MAG: dockerin type I repeat-containing protein [candidate division Zixibacteria bacterium]|nr:dockerin type I repeat-containing protein [candidate division Zixibacteria bacterium]
MNRNLVWKASLSLALFGITIAGSAFAIDKDTSEKLRLLAVRTARYAVASDSRAHPTYGQPVSPGAVGRYIGATAGASNLGCVPGEAPDPVRGLTVGCTFYDYQKNGTMDRQIATVPPDLNINFVWTNQDNNSATGGRNVRYEAYDPANGWLVDNTGGVDIGPSLIPPDRSGYATIDAAVNGTAVIGFHWNINFGVAGSRFFNYVSHNQTPTLGDYVNVRVDTLIYDTVSLFQAGDQNIWPRVAYTNGASPATSVYHIVAKTDNNNTNYFTYTRRVGPPPNAWEPAFIFGFSGLLSASVTAARTSNDVAIYWSGGRGDKTLNNCSIDRSNGLLSGQWDNDMYYMKSTDAGANWGLCQNVTLRAENAGFAPNARTSGVFDLSGNLHLVWNAAQWPEAAQPFNFRSRIFHWDETNAAVRIVHDAVWDPTTCNPGAFKLNQGEVQITECDSKLYVTFALYAPTPLGLDDDCSIRASTDPDGAANGDLWVTVSSNGGFNWDPARNLTNTYTPNCDTAPGGANPDCDSDAWQSALRYGINVTGFDFAAITDLTANLDVGFVGSLYNVVSYMNDADPGAAIQSEGGWTNNKYKVIRYGCVDIVEAAVLASTIPVGQAVQDPAFTLPGSDSAIAWTLTNVGNIPLTYEINIVADVPLGNVTVTGGTGTIDNGAINSESLSLRLNALEEETVQNATATIVISGNFTTSPDTFLIDYVIADLQLLVSDSLDDFFILSNNGNIGLANNSGAGRLNFDFVGDVTECDTTATSYLFDGSPITSYNSGIVVSSMFSASIVDTFQWRPLTPPTVDVDGSYEHANSGAFTTQDSTIGVTVDYWTPAGNLPVPGTWKAVIGRASFYNMTDSSIDSVFAAFGWDWDVPSDSGARNSSTIEPGPSPTYIYQQGAEFGVDTGISACRDNSARYAATIYTPPSAAFVDPYTTGGSGRMGVGFQSMYTRDNATFVNRDWDHPAIDSMLRGKVGVFPAVGFSIFSSPAPDSQYVDLHTILNGGAYRIDPDDTLELWFHMLTGFGSQAEFDAAVAATIFGIITPPGCCVLAGDANDDGRVNTADITFLIARIFAGGPAPPCCAQGNANGDGSVNIADVTYLIARIFAGGPAPVCGLPGIGC